MKPFLFAVLSLFFTTSVWAISLEEGLYGTTSRYCGYYVIHSGKRILIELRNNPYYPTIRCGQVGRRWTLEESEEIGTYVIIADTNSSMGRAALTIQSSHAFLWDGDREVLYTHSGQCR
jgi:hypothetical protein